MLSFWICDVPPLIEFLGPGLDGIPAAGEMEGEPVRSLNEIVRFSMSTFPGAALIGAHFIPCQPRPRNHCQTFEPKR